MAGSIFIIIHADKTVENLISLLRRYSATRVGHDEIHEPVLPARAAVNPDFSLGRCLAGI